MTVAYLAAAGYRRPLQEELERAGLGPALRWFDERLVLCDAPAVDAAWAVNTWFDVEELAVRSIADAAAQLRDRQRNWCAYPPGVGGRAALISARLPHVSGRALQLGETAPASPLGSWALAAPDRLLAAARCSSPFPNGEVPLAEHRQGPPSRAYRKLWEAFVRLGHYPGPGELAIDLGASPGGWTWLLHELGARVVAVDRAPLAPEIDSLPGVWAVAAGAFGLDAAALVATHGAPQWVCSDIAGYPGRVVELVRTWRAAAPAATLVMTVKFQGNTDHDAVDALRAEGATPAHLHHNKHELTLLAEPSR
ncbi:MAG: SAM-dependent methyltransferase [Acidimicrobiales bacterium]